MTRGLARKNNLSDLTSRETARINLGLATADLNRIRGLYTSAGVSNVDVQRIAGSASNYQAQLNSLNSIFSSIDASLRVSRSGDTIISGWTNTGYIVPGVVVQSGVTLSGSSDSLFTLTVLGLNFALSATALVMQSGVTTERFSGNDGLVLASGVTANKLIPITIGSAPYFLEAG